MDLDLQVFLINVCHKSYNNYVEILDQTSVELHKYSFNYENFEHRQIHIYRNKVKILFLVSKNSCRSSYNKKFFFLFIIYRFFKNSKIKHRM